MPLALLLPNGCQPLNYPTPILHNPIEAAIVTDTNWHIQIWNRAAEVIYGWHSSQSLAEQVQGKSLWEAIGAHGSELDGISREEAIAHLYQHSYWKGQMLHRQRNGREIVVESSLQLIRDERGVIIGIVNINRLLTKKTSSKKQKTTQKRYCSHWNSKKAMRLSEARFRIVAETAPVMLWMSGPEALCTFFNQRWLEFTGRSLEEELGNGWTASIHPDDFQHCLEIFRRAFNARRSFKIKYRLRRKDGEYRWILDMGVPKLMPSGQLAGYVGSCIDLSLAIARRRYPNLMAIRNTSARQPAEASLISQAEFLRTILDTTPNLIFVKDAEGKYVFVNQAVADFYGTSLENLIGKLETEFNPHPNREKLLLPNGAEIIAPRQEKFIFSQTLIDSNGKVRWFQTVEKPMLMPKSPDNPGSETLYILSVASDITDLRWDWNDEESTFTSKLKSQQTEDTGEQANKPLKTLFQERTAALMQANEQMLVEMQSGQWTSGALRPSEAYLRTLLAAMTDVIIVINDRGCYLKIAPTNAKLLCKPAVELIGKTLHEVFERSQADIFLGHIRRALETQKTIEIEYSLPISTLNNPGRSLLRWFSASLLPIQANTVIWVARDITDATGDFNHEESTLQSQLQRQQAEEALRQANEQLEMRVEERTAALRESNDNLVVEIAQRVRAEKQLRQHQENLEELVRKRTAELEQTNQQLRQEIVERKRIEKALFQEKELAQVTLQSIGDAVITTDASGLVTSLNPAAQRLTGWFPPDAIGLPVSQVFHIIHELTRELVENPVETALYTQRIVELSNHTLLISRDGDEFAIDESAAPIRASDGQIVGAVLVFHDVTEERALARRLSWQASHDALTGLANRREFEQHLKRAWLAAQTQNQQHTLCYMDLDRFKYVNDTCGHVAGDELLRQISALLQSKVRKTDTLARLGGDEFGLLLQYCSLDEAIRVANELRQVIQEFRFLWRDKTCTIGVSIGLVGIDAHSNNPASLMSAADAACYEAKNQGRDRVYVYQAEEGERSLQRQEIQWAIHLPKALESDRFRLYHQSIISVAATEPISEHYEVLLRLEDENGNLVSPTAFLPAAERYNLMPTIDRWVIRNLFTHQGQHYRQSWNRCQINGCQCLYTINLSGASLNDEQFIDFVVEQFTLHEIPPEVICFEITETVAISNLSKAAALVGDLKALGCRFTLDDFGSSVSCLAYLKNLPVDYLKIDGNFVKNIVSDPINCAMVEAINQIAHLMGLQTIAEFVENDDILNKLRELGVDYAQGYGIAKPHPLPFQPRE